jgi:hypothetical protein
MDFSFRFADKETVEHRLNICDACEHKVLLVCSKCGCICAAKARKKNSSCPIGKWSAVVETANTTSNKSL